MAAERDSLRDWHRLFGLTWMDFLQDTPIDVETEIDLSLKQQFVDVVLIRKGTEPILRELPDGFDDLAAYNLMTFKSHHEALDGWALCELVGHYVNYRKQMSPSMQELLPESDYRLFAVCARYPLQLSRRITFTTVREAVYDLQFGTVPIRVIVVSQLPLEKRNAMLHLFSAREGLLRYGRENYRPQSPETSTVLYELFKAYREDPEMNEKLKQFVRESNKEIFKGMTVEEVIRSLPPETLRELAHVLQANGTTPKPAEKAEPPK
jgi:hypothetical protein